MRLPNLDPNVRWVMPEEEPADHSKGQVAPKKTEALDSDSLDNHGLVRVINVDVDRLLDNCLKVG